MPLQQKLWDRYYLVYEALEERTLSVIEFAGAGCSIVQKPPL